MRKKEKIEDIKVRNLKRSEVSDKVIYIRTTEKIFKWMKQNRISPSKLFNNSAEVIMARKEKKE